MEKLSRIGIFLFRDEQGIVDDYVCYLLNDMCKNLDMLYIVVNGVLTEDGRVLLKRYTDEIIIRPDKGFDVGGWQDVILNHCGFEKILKYDELILFNDSFFGPLYPFREVFEKMDKEDVDFWGLSSHGAAPGSGNCPYGNRPKYLQTYFVAFRNKLVSSVEFQNFWHNLPIFTKFEQVGEGYGCVFTKGFEDLGYRWMAFSDTTDLESKDIRKNMSFHTFNPYDMVVNRKFPIIKRKVFITGKETVLRFNYADELRKTMKYVKENTNYDVSLIYKYILRVYNLYDLKNSLNLNFVLSHNLMDEKYDFINRKKAVVAHLFYPELFEKNISYLKNVVSTIDIFITVSEKEKKEKLEVLCSENGLENVIVRLVNSRGRDLSALLVGCHDILMQYDYLCFVHDKKSVQKEYVTVGASFATLLWDNMLKSPEYIHNILTLLENNPQLGLLVPPNVYHGTYYASSVDFWTICYEQTVQLANALNITSRIEKGKPPISVGTVFWCKPKALINLFEFKFDYEDFPEEPMPNDGSISHALERLIPYVAQHNGYFTGTVMNCEYAEAEVTNFRYMLTDIQRQLRGVPGLRFDTHMMLVMSLKKMKVEFMNLKQNKTIVEKVVYLPSEDKISIPMVSKIANVQEKEEVEIVEKIVYMEIGLKGAFVNYIKKRWPNWLVKAVRKIVKY